MERPAPEPYPLLLYSVAVSWLAALSSAHVARSLSGSLCDGMSDGSTPLSTSPDKRALLPVTPAALDTAAVIGLTEHHAAQLEAARRPAFSGSARMSALP